MRNILLFFILAFVFVQPSLAMPRLSRELQGTVQSVDATKKSISILPNGDKEAKTFQWKNETQFIKDNSFVSSSEVREGLSVKVRYRAPLFGASFVTKVMWTNQKKTLAKSGDE